MISNFFVKRLNNAENPCYALATKDGLQLFSSLTLIDFLANDDVIESVSSDSIDGIKVSFFDSIHDLFSFALDSILLGHAKGAETTNYIIDQDGIHAQCTQRKLTSFICCRDTTLSDEFSRFVDFIEHNGFSKAFHDVLIKRIPDAVSSNHHATNDLLRLRKHFAIKLEGG